MKKQLIRAAIAVACLSAAGNAAIAQEVQLHVDWSQKRWDGYPDSVGKSTSEWKDHQLYVHTIVDWNSSFEISDQNPRALLHGDKLLLCYEQKSAVDDKKRPAAPGVVAPVILEFIVKGIPEHNYSVDISNKCS